MPKAKAKMSERALKARDAKRDLGAELLASVREMKAGQVASSNREFRAQNAVILPRRA